MKNSETKVFNALGDATRRAIFDKLRSRPLAVVDIAKGLPISRPAVSQHLKVLRDAKLIKVTQHGTRNLCEIDPKGIAVMRHYLDNFWDNALQSFKAIAEKQ